MNDSRIQAKKIILALLRCSGSKGLGKTKIFKAFWLAHLYYAKNNRGYLSDWPVVRMPNGPGIDDGYRLIDELRTSGEIVCEEVQIGPFQEQNCSIGPRAPDECLSNESLIAIKQATDFVMDKTAAELSDFSHEKMRSWRETSNGKSLNIYSDLLSDVEYAELTQNQEKIEELMGGIFK